MNRQELHAHRRNSSRGPTNGFFDVEELEIQKHPLAPRDQALNHFRSGGSVEFESNFHKHDLILDSFKELLGLSA
jgi:hypothetical protein